MLANRAVPAAWRWIDADNRPQIKRQGHGLYLAPIYRLNSPLPKKVREGAKFRALRVRIQGRDLMLDHVGEGVRSDGPRLRLAVCGRPRLTKGLSIAKSRAVGRSRKYVMTKKDEYRRFAASMAGRWVLAEVLRSPIKSSAEWLQAANDRIYWQRNRLTPAEPLQHSPIKSSAEWLQSGSQRPNLLAAQSFDACRTTPASRAHAHVSTCRRIPDRSRRECATGP